MTSALHALAPELVRAFGSPLYVYDEELLRDRCRRMRAAIPLSGVDILYAMKANANPALLRVIRDEGLGVDAVSIGEVVLGRRCGFPADRISFNGNNVDEAEMRAVVEEGVHLCADSLSQLERFSRLRLGARAALRLNPDVGAGHHDHVITGGPDAKFGVAPDELPEALAIARSGGLVIDGVQQHIGSGILATDRLLFAVDVLLDAASRLPDLRYVDFGGGIGVPYRPEDQPFDLAGFGERVRERLERFRKSAGRDIAFRFEPGRYIVAECGALLVTVTAVKRTARHVFVGTDSGFNHLIRPMLYGAYHAIENLSNPRGAPVTVRVAGNICESGDLFAIDRELPEAREGDILAIRTAGAYGWSMASPYNQRPRPAEILVRGDSYRAIRRRETFDDLWSTCLDGP
jgi:diaminopimelate decarboxylase